MNCEGQVIVTSTEDKTTVQIKKIFSMIILKQYCLTEESRIRKRRTYLGTIPETARKE